MCVKCNIVWAFGFQANVGAVVCIFVMLIYGEGGRGSLCFERLRTSQQVHKAGGSIVQISQYDLIFAFYSVFINIMYPVVEVMWWAIHGASKAVLGCTTRQQNTGRTVGKNLRGGKKNIMNYWKAIKLAHAVTPLNCVWEMVGVESRNTGYPDKGFCVIFRQLLREN